MFFGNSFYRTASPLSTKHFALFMLLMSVLIPVLFVLRSPKYQCRIILLVIQLVLSHHLISLHIFLRLLVQHQDLLEVQWPLVLTFQIRVLFEHLIHISVRRQTKAAESRLSRFNFYILLRINFHIYMLGFLQYN